jgi:hypothetical protein
MAGCTNDSREPFRPRSMNEGLLNQTSSRRASRPYGRPGQGARVLQAYTHYYNETRIYRSLSKDAPCHRAIECFGVITRDLFITAIAGSDFRYNSRGFAYATSSSATGEPPCNESSNARHRYFPRTPFFVAFELAGCQQLIAPRVAACEHLPRNLRFDDKRLEVTSFRAEI